MSLITVHDILDIYERTGLKPSIGYRDYSINDSGITRGCVVTAIYCDENKDDSFDPDTRNMLRYCYNKFGELKSDSLEAGFCGWAYMKSYDKEYYDIGKKAADILFNKNGE